jgi:formylglycine-generating enzyme required for sulfatase activity/tRNA A-37 threonylcarbamoyl transferase component Bud32
MGMTLSLFRVLGKVALNAVGGGIAGDLVFEFLPEVAQKAWTGWTAETNESQRRLEIEELAQASPDQVRRWVKDTVEEVAGGQPEAVRQKLAGYLMQMPASVRQSMRRPTDPTGATVPVGLTLRKASDLLALLPKRPPRFHAGDRPLTGVDLVLEEMLGVGGFGEVWKARNPNRPRAEPVALKFCLDQAAAASLRNEVDVLDRIMSAGRHPGIVPLLHTYLSAEPPCLEFQFVEGGDLAGLIQEWHASGNRPTPEQALRVLRHLTEAVAFAHEQQPPIVHRDLKPANVLVRRDAEGKFHYLISDFGLGALVTDAAGQKPTRSSRSGVSAYTPLYASPEQIKGEHPAPTDDVYALGVIWYQLLNGDLERGAPTGLGWIKELSKQGVGEEQLHLMAACFASHASERPVNAPALLANLDAILAAAPAAPPGRKPTQKALAPVKEQPKRQPAPDPVVPRRRRPALPVVLILLVVLAAAAIVIAWPYLGLFTGSSEQTRSKDAPPFSAKNMPAEWTGPVGMKFVRIPAGFFDMGSPVGENGRDQNEEPVHRVKISRPFFLGMYEVTQEEYTAVMESSPFAFCSTGEKKKFAERVNGQETNRFPAENVSRAQAEEFCRRLTSRPGTYSGWVFRLPTEAEWEYACRAGTSTPVALSMNKSLAGGQANFDSEQPYGVAQPQKAPNHPIKVGSFVPNAWSLHDMHGNVREWVADGYKDRYAAGELLDPFVKPIPDMGVTRGGCWFDAGEYCRSARRQESDPDRGSAYTGFRVAVSLPESSR